MKQIVFIVAIIFGYQWLVQNGYTDDFLKAIGNFDPKEFIGFLQSLATELTELAKETFKDLKK